MFAPELAQSQHHVLEHVAPTSFRFRFSTARPAVPRSLFPSPRHVTFWSGSLLLQINTSAKRCKLAQLQTGSMSIACTSHRLRHLTFEGPRLRIAYRTKLHQTSLRISVMRISPLFLSLAQLANAGYWMEEIGHHGISPYHPDDAYQVFRNVKEFGAVGDGGS